MEAKSGNEYLTFHFQTSSSKFAKWLALIVKTTNSHFFQKTGTLVQVSNANEANSGDIHFQVICDVIARAWGKKF